MAGRKGRSGRRKEPAAAKIAKGTYRKSRDADPVDLPQGLPPVPEDLHPTATAEWERLAPLCSQVGLLTVADWLAWELGFRAYAQWIEASASIGDPVWVTDKGYPVMRPEVTIAKQAWAAVLTFCREFGLTPSARSGLKLTGEFESVKQRDSGDPLESMLD